MFRTSQSPDLNPIEYLWEELDCQVRNKNYTNKKNLLATLQKKTEKYAYKQTN